MKLAIQAARNAQAEAKKSVARTRTVTRGNYVETTSFNAYGREGSVNHRDTSSDTVIGRKRILRKLSDEPN
ncbi:MAG: hypothetical protein H0V16_12365 [Burkholderiaceae bacterium]|nr:hypothetical protein [Burkholderiaceae bacterium]